MKLARRRTGARRALDAWPLLASLLIACPASAAAAAPSAPSAVPPSAPAAAPSPAPAAAPPAASPAGAEGHWEGAIDVPGGSLPVLVDLSRAGAVGAWTGAIDIPTQGAKQLPLDEVTVAGDKVRFAIRGVPGAPTFDGTLAGGAIQGTFTQGGASIPFHLGRQPVKLPRRAQEPKPPYPYVQREVAYDNGAVHLAGTLTLPPGPGPFPAVLLITGSGPQNRDEEIFGHKPFLVIADHLTGAGIAVLRVDDRGVGGSTGRDAAATTADFTTDVLAGGRFLKAQPEIAKSSIGLLGHSEGGIIAPQAASRSRDVAFIILLAGTGEPGYDLLLDQIAAMARAEGASEEAVRKQVDLERQALDLVRGEKDEATLRAKLAPLIRAGGEIASPEEKTPRRGTPDAAVEAELRAAVSPWFRYFVSYDPRAALRLVRVPVLALGGDKDVQVPAAKNLVSIEHALREGGDQDVTTHVLPGLNHLFQHAKTGSPAEYGAIEETIAPEALDLVTHWILDRFAVKPAAAHGRPQGQRSRLHA